MLTKCQRVQLWYKRTSNLGPLVLLNTLLLNCISWWLRRNLWHVSGHCAATKFEALYDGPYTVTAVNANKVSYKLQHCATGVVSRAHHNQLKFWKQAPNYLQKHPYFKLGLLHLIESLPDVLPVDDSSGEQEFLCDSADVSSSTNESSIGWMFTDSDSDNSPSAETAAVSPKDFSGFTERSKSFSGFTASLPISRNQQQQHNCSGCAFELDLWSCVREVTCHLQTLIPIWQRQG